MLWIRWLALASPSRSVRGRVHRPACFSLQTVEHGFPHQPSALGYSPSLRILAIGTRSGAVKLYPFRPASSAQGGPGRVGDLGIGEIPEGPPPSKKINNNDPSDSQDVLNVLSGVSPEGSKWRQVVGQEDFFFFLTFFPVRVSRLSPGSVQTKTGWPWVRGAVRGSCSSRFSLYCAYTLHTHVCVQTPEGRVDACLVGTVLPWLRLDIVQLGHLFSRALLLG